jgi:murein DD-endopeptidase MepM/ murein hydrolase activator NlpD
MWNDLVQSFLKVLQAMFQKPTSTPQSIHSPPTPIPVVVPTVMPQVVVDTTPIPIPVPPLSNGTFLICPIQLSVNGQPLTPYTAKISAIIDHSGTSIDPKSTKTWGIVAKDQKTRAFNGEVGDSQPSAGAPYGYTKQVSAPFFANKEINYVGAPGPGDTYGPTYYLNYDGHAGYDFAYPVMTAIQVTADGDLYKAQSDSIDGANRNWYLKKFGKDNPTAWEGWHTFYIKHPNGYSSYFLHCTKLVDEIENQLQDYGKCVPVKQGQLIAYTGNYGGVPAHLHFEVRNRDGKIVDPYCDKLWL